MLGEHARVFIEDNQFIECGTNPRDGNAERVAAISLFDGTTAVGNTFADYQQTAATLTTALAGTNNDLDVHFCVSASLLRRPGRRPSFRSST